MGIQEAALGLIGNSDASGQVGRRVAQRLARQGFRQRLLVQDRSQGPELPLSEVAPISDYGDTKSMRKAVAGVDT
jgi:NAD(P)H dehydrogenase (quinone)